MKKIFSIILVITILISMTACGFNKRLIDVNYKFTKAYINTFSGSIEVDIKGWSEDSTTITIITTDGTVYCTGQENIVLIQE